MFGYIVPAPDVLSEADRQLWQGYYCSLCRTIGKRSQPARLGLSYDMTFLALLTDALSENNCGNIGTSRCILHPMRKTERFSSSALDYAADVGIILTKAKLDDDARDEKNPLYRIADSVIKDRAEGMSEVRNAVSTSLRRLAEIEERNICDADEAADAFAVLCGELFRLSPSPDTAKKTLYWLGYNLGRWIYLADAWDDLERDIKKGSYNPFKSGESFEEIKKTKGVQMEEILAFTLAEAAAAFDLLKIRRYRTLLENIIYVGLPARLREVMQGKERKRTV